MNEKKKTEKQIAPGGGGSIFDGAHDLAVNLNVSVASGPYSEDLPVAGKTVGEIRKKYSDRFDIDPESQAIVNGKPAGEDVVLHTGEALMFIKHAGEKGAATVLLESNRATATDADMHSTMPLPHLLQRLNGSGLSTGELVLPFGVKAVLSQGNITLLVWEQPPRVVQLSWIAANSPEPFGRGTKYRNVRIALPYLIIVAPFFMDGGRPSLMLKDECFFRNQPLTSLDEELLFPALLNCSRWPDVYGMNHPLSWICTQHLKENKKMSSSNPGDVFCASLEAVRYCLLETSFNLSSEHHEGNSWFGESKQTIPEIKTVKDWEANTQKDPLFAIEVPWLKTGLSVRQLAQRIFQQQCATATQVACAEDVARLIFNQ